MAARVGRGVVEHHALQFGLDLDAALRQQLRDQLRVVNHLVVAAKFGVLVAQRIQPCGSQVTMRFTARPLSVSTSVPAIC